MSKQIELTNPHTVPLNPIFLSIPSLVDSSENSEPEEVEEVQAPSLQNLHQELMSPYTDALKNSFNAALVGYLKALPQQEMQAQHSGTGIKELQQQAIEALHTYLNHSKTISVIEECRKPCTCCSIFPPYLLQKIYPIDQMREEVLVNQVSEGSSGKLKESHSIAHKEAIDLTNRVKENLKNSPSQREARALPQNATAPVNQGTLITVYDAQLTTELPGTFIVSNLSDKKSSKKIDNMARNILQAAKDVHEFWLKNFNLNSYDGKGAEIRSTIHYASYLGNAFWNGQQMVFGDRHKYSGKLAHISVVGHEFGHAVTGGRLMYEGESGTLNEHLSDVWGALLEQYKNRHAVHEASWLIGEGFLKVKGKKFPLRSMKEPGTAYDCAALGKDPQPDHYDKRYVGEEDNGGVHINSGIPNKAFYLFATSQRGYAWEKPGHLWFLTLQTEGLLRPNCTMHEFAQATLYTALKNFPEDYKMHRDLAAAWKAVGLGMA